MSNTGHTPAPADTPLTLTTLGGARLALSNGRERCGPGKPLALLVYLACSPRRTATREHLLDLLWSDLPPDRARHALRQLIWHLRQALGDEAIQSRGSEIALVLPCQFDREEFRRSIADGDAERAVALYGGDFLTGFAAPGGADFEHWADIEREQLRTAFLRTGESLARQWLREGRIRDAKALAHRLRDTAPRHEAAWRLLLESLLAGGDTLALTLEIAAFEEHWRNDNRELEPATRALLQRASGLEAEAAIVTPGGLVPELVGREKEFAELLRAWEQARRGRATHLHLSGAAGLGKSRLLADAQKRLRGLGAPVVALRATPAQRQIAYGFLGELVLAVSERPGTAAISPAAAGSLVALHPSLSGRFATPLDAASGEEALRRRTAALTELLTVAADETPFALLLDDMHWLDAASRQVLAATLERIEGTPLLCVTAARHGTGLETLASTRLELRPLGEPEVAGLITSLGTLPDEGWASSLAGAVHHSADGIPLLVLETLQLALDRGRLQLNGGEWRCPAPVELAHQLRVGSALRLRIATLAAEDRWFLLILAVAGAALTATDLAAVSQRDSRAIEEILSGLEQRGFLCRSGDHWLPSHDEIAALTIDLAPEDARLRAHAGLGHMIAESAEHGGPGLIQAAHHLAAAGRKAEVIGLFARHLGQIRRLGDGRRVGEVAYEFLGEGTPPAEVLALVRGLPLWTRVRWSSARNVAAAAVLLVLAAGGMLAAFNRERTAEAVLVIPGLGDPTHRGAPGLSLRIEDWQDREPFQVDQVPFVRLPSDSPTSSQFVPSPDGTQWLFVRTHDALGDSTTSDIYLRGGDGNESRLTFNRHDDTDPAWAPDGSAMVWVTSQWSPPGADNYDLAVLDLRSHTTRPLTGGRPADTHPQFSPDGTRIGFVRTYDERLPTFCWIAQDGSATPVCPEIPGFFVSQFVGWADNDEVFLVADSAAGQRLLRYDLTSRVVSTVDRRALGAGLSPDGRWLAIWRDVALDGDELGLFVAPTSNPMMLRRVMSRETISKRSLVWLGTRAVPRFLDRFSIAAPTGDSIGVNLTTQLTVNGWTPTGEALPELEPLTWQSSDTTILAVDSSGIAVPRRIGQALVSVSAGGWRQATVSLTVFEARDSTVLQEDWTAALAPHWIGYGDPFPVIAEHRDGTPGFWNRGDGSYPSGAYSRDHWDARKGLGVEALISVPLNRGQWQVAALTLVGGLDSLHLGAWDHHTGGFPWNDPDQVCGFNYPQGEGLLGKMRFASSVGARPHYTSVDSSLGNGRWFRVRVQIFPDGRCGVALDGVPLWRPRRALKLDRPFAINLGNQSSGTKVLHGQLEVWQGVRNDIPWNDLGQR